MIDQSPPVGKFSPLSSPRFWAIFLPLSLLTGCVVFVLYDKDVANEYLLHEQAGVHLVGLLWDIITRELKGAKSDLLYLPNQAPLREDLAGPAARQAQLHDEHPLFTKQPVLL